MRSWKGWGLSLVSNSKHEKGADWHLNVFSEIDGVSSKESWMVVLLGVLRTVYSLLLFRLRSEMAASHSLQQILAAACSRLKQSAHMLHSQLRHRLAVASVKSLRKFQFLRLSKRLHFFKTQFPLGVPLVVQLGGNSTHQG